MHREFCTLFDANYVFKAVALHASLERHCPSFTLTAFCFDERARETIDALALPGVRTVALAELEAADPAFHSTKGDRSPGEYCWTATPALPLHVLRTRPEVDEITYLDADLMFFADPEPLFAEMGDASVLITPHRYSPRHARDAINGLYNVQFMFFRRDERGMAALEWWHDRCVEWCYSRLEDGKFGDQKYLDDWPQRFEGVHVLQHKGGGLAPWNMSQYDLRRAPDGRLLVDGEALIFFHYHRTQLRRSGPHAWKPQGYSICARERALVYDPYVAALDAAIARVRRTDPSFDAGFTPAPTLRERGAHAVGTLAARAFDRFPFLLRVRHPLAGRAS